MLSCDVSTCIDHVNYPTITCHLIISNDNNFKNKRTTKRPWQLYLLITDILETPSDHTELTLNPQLTSAHVVHISGPTKVLTVYVNENQLSNIGELISKHMSRKEFTCSVVNVRSYRVNPEKYQPVQDQVEKDQQENQESQAQLRKWANTFSLQKLCSIWWNDDRKVVASDNNLKRGVSCLYHDAPTIGHLGISNTYRIVKKDFWWPNMKQDIEQYVKGCTTCQANKANTRPLKPAMMPITPQHHLPFQTVAMVFGRHDLAGRGMERSCGTAG